MPTDLTPEEVQQLVDAINSGNAMPYVDKMLRLLTETWECEKLDRRWIDGLRDYVAINDPCGSCSNCHKLAIVEGMK